MQPNQPSVTPAAVAATVVGLIAPVAVLLGTFGVYTLTAAQQDAISKLVFALAGLGAVIVAADSHLRAARNKARAVIEAAKPTEPDSAPLALPVTPAPRSHKKKV